MSFGPSFMDQERGANHYDINNIADDDSDSEGETREWATHRPNGLLPKNIPPTHD